MNLIYAALLIVISLLLMAAAVTRAGSWMIEKNNPPVGAFVTVNDTKLHYVHMQAGPNADLPPILFLHGASGNLQDAMSVYAEKLGGRADLIFVDRPGHGYSTRGPATNSKPDGQAATMAAMIEKLAINKAIVVGHSFGGVVAVSFALNHPDMTIGTLFLSPVSHPWPGGISWYYNFTAMPIIGSLFTQTIALPAGLSRIQSGTDCVFAPNQPTPDYGKKTAVSLVLRPRHFQANAIDVAGLFEYVSKISPRYGEIKTPAIIITGDKDTIVLPKVHSIGLNRDIENSQLIWVKNMGHKPDHIAPDLVIAALENLAGANNDLPAMRDAVEARIANDKFGPLEKCLDNAEIKAAVLPQTAGD